MDNVRTGLLIAQIRKEKGYTQKDLAEKIGVSNATVSKWDTRSCTNIQNSLPIFAQPQL